MEAPRLDQAHQRSADDEVAINLVGRESARVVSQQSSLGQCLLILAGFAFSFLQFRKAREQNSWQFFPTKVIKMAYRRNCQMLDNDNYRDWARKHPDPEIRKWLKSSQRVLQMNFYFDSELGCFETLDGNPSNAPVFFR